MTQEELDVAIAEIIIPQIKPKYKTNSYFKKQNEKRIIRKNISYILHESRIEAHKWKLYRYKYCKRYEDLYHRFRGIGIVYKPGKTDRFKKISYTYSGKDKRLSKLDKRLCIRGTRRYIGSISNGSNYKHCLCRINRHLNFWSDYYDE